MTTQNVETPKLVYEISSRGRGALQIVASDPDGIAGTSVIDVRHGLSVGEFKSFGNGPLFTRETVNPTVLATA